MSGTLFGLGLSQRIKATGRPESGWKLYVYAAGTSTPSVTYKDTALTVGQEHPFPIVADSLGMMPAFWVADGSYRARGVSSDGGTVFFDLTSVLAIGASSGGGGGGDTTDPNSIASTGDVKWRPITGAISGWVRMNGRTIGSATSGATERANADVQTLFEYAWNNFSDTFCPVITGRGASSAADWAANKLITTLDMRRRSPFGLVDMGNTALTDFDSLTFTLGDKSTGGATLGASTVTMARANLPNDTLSIAIASGQGSHSHLMNSKNNMNYLGINGGGAGGIEVVQTNSGSASILTSTQTLPSMTGTAALNGGVTQTAMPNMPTAMLGSWYWRL